MAIFVVDASAALSWCFEDEANSWSDALLDRLRQGDQIVVPAHWPAEILNGLLVASRRKHIKADQRALLWEQILGLPIEVEPPLTFSLGGVAIVLSEKHVLTVYDAAYLELALRRNLPLGTLDADLRKAAQAESVPLL